MSEMTVSLPDVKSSSLGGDPYQASSFVLLDDLQRRERNRKRLQSLIDSWPILVGIVLSLAAPMMKDMLEVIKPWGMRLVFPFVELMARPELHMGSDFSQYAPQAMLFLQFPLYGLFAKKVLKGKVTVSGVATQAFLYHFLGVVQIWLVCRALGSVPLR
jgi:hypothetical protein